MKKVYYQELAPVVLFVYKRLESTRLAVESLLSNHEAASTDLVIFSDGPKCNQDAPKVSEVRRYIASIQGFKSIKVIKRAANLGLANSFIQGVSEVVDSHGLAIVLEDDNIVSKYFLNFMNNCLSIYKDDLSVSCVSGYSWPFWPRYQRPYFLKGAETWTFATWKRSWTKFEKNGSKLMEAIKARNLYNIVDPYEQGYLQMLIDQICGNNDSWGVRWWVSAFLNQQVCLYPHVPLAVVADPGTESTHCAKWSPLFRATHELSDFPVVDYPASATEASLAKLRFKIMNYQLRVRSLASRVSHTFSAYQD